MALSTLTKIPLSGSTYGRQVLVAATTLASGTTIHTATASTTAGLADEVTLYAMNTDGSNAHTLQIGFGGTGTADTSKYTLAAGVTTLVIPGWILQNSLVVVAACDSTTQVALGGYAIRPA